MTGIYTWYYLRQWNVYYYFHWQQIRTKLLNMPVNFIKRHDAMLKINNFYTNIGSKISTLKSKLVSALESWWIGMLCSFCLICCVWLHEHCCYNWAEHWLKLFVLYCAHMVQYVFWALFPQNELCSMGRSSQIGGSSEGSTWVYICKNCVCISAGNIPEKSDNSVAHCWLRQETL
jgi:hypothetical protein